MREKRHVFSTWQTPKSKERKRRNVIRIETEFSNVIALRADQPRIVPREPNELNSKCKRLRKDSSAWSTATTPPLSPSTNMHRNKQKRLPSWRESTLRHLSRGWKGSMQSITDGPIQASLGTKEKSRPRGRSIWEVAWLEAMRRSVFKTRRWRHNSQRLPNRIEKKKKIHQGLKWLASTSTDRRACESVTC